MFEILETLLTQFITLIPTIIALFIVFELIGSLLFERR